MEQILAEWRIISAQIKSLLEAGTYLFQALQVNDSDSYGALKKFILPSALKTFEHIVNFRKDFESSLPSEIETTLKDFIESNETIFTGNVSTVDQAKEFAKVVLVALTSIDADVSYHLNDTQVRICKAVEIAFAHLQRQLVADESVKNTWASKQHETDFEKLGGAHLLLHKIWAFKVNAIGERTDLVLSEPIKTDDTLYQSANGLVLTEWKVVRSADKIEDKIAEAKSQAQRYAGGSLAALELSTHRFLIIVSEDYVDIPQDEIKDGRITYRVINIAYSPSIPSKAASKRS